jgi:hypothetical protein
MKTKTIYNQLKSFDLHDSPTLLQTRTAAQADPQKVEKTKQASRQIESAKAKSKHKNSGIMIHKSKQPMLTMVFEIVQRLQSKKAVRTNIPWRQRSIRVQRQHRTSKNADLPDKEQPGVFPQASRQTSTE